MHPVLAEGGHLAVADAGTGIVLVAPQRLSYLLWGERCITLGASILLLPSLRQCSQCVGVQLLFGLKRSKHGLVDLTHQGGRTCWLFVTPSCMLSPFSSLFLGPGMWPDVPRSTAGVLRALLPACTGITVAPLFWGGCAGSCRPAWCSDQGSRMCLLLGQERQHRILHLLHALKEAPSCLCSLGRIVGCNPAGGGVVIRVGSVPKGSCLGEQRPLIQNRGQLQAAQSSQ